MNYIPVDAGFGYYKIIVNGKEIKFANITGNYNFSLNGLTDDIPLSISVDGLGAWNFGETALLQSTSPNRRQSNDRIFDNEFLAGLLLAISSGYSPETKRIECAIMTGLPGQDFNRLKENSELKRKFKNHIIGDYRVQRPSYRQHITITDIKYTQQAWGAIWKQVLDKQGNIIKPDVGKVDSVLFGCGNVGYNTLEVGLTKVSNLRSGVPKIRLVEGRQLSTGLGVHTIIDRVVTDLSNKFNRNFEREQALDILEAGALIDDGQEHEYKLPDSIKNELVNTVYSAITNIIQNDIKSLYKLILTGGGANIVKEGFNHIPQLSISKKPQFDTVAGYGRLAKLMDKKQRA